MTKTQNIFEQHLRLAASYTSKEAADHEEPESNHPCFLLATPYAHRQGSKILCLGKILICQKSIVLDFDILIVRQELPDVTRHVTRRRARPPMPPFRKLGHCNCTDMLHSSLLHILFYHSRLLRLKIVLSYEGGYCGAYLYNAPVSGRVAWEDELSVWSRVWPRRAARA